MTERRFTRVQIINRLLLTAACSIFALSAYFAFSFFFDVFAEATPILLLIPVCAGILFACRRDVGQKFTIVFTSIIMIVAVAAAVATGVVATSIPAYGIDPVCGSVETYTYSREFMRDNYDIDQKTEINVWLPEGYNENNEYPVMYVLDGDNLFNYAAVKASELCASGDGDVIVVGVGYGYWNATFARGGIVWQDEKHLKGRWRDFCFADDTEIGYMGDVFGGEYKRGAEFVDFLCNTVVRDVCERYSVDRADSTVFGHSLGGGMAAYLLTCYDPVLGLGNPFTRFVIVDNGYCDYYLKHVDRLEEAMAAGGGKAYESLAVYRIWGGTVDVGKNEQQFGLYEMLNEYGWDNFENYFWIPQGANHADTQVLGIDNALYMILGKDFGHMTVTVKSEA